MSKIIDLIGKKFNRLTVMAKSDRLIKEGSLWVCVCDCGNTIEAKSIYLRKGVTNSCGCLLKEITSKKFKKHGLSSSHIHGVWNAMVQRCINPKTKSYDFYGGRGIKVCDRWMNFELFYEDMGSSYKEGLTLERENVDGDYELPNCSWQTSYVQRRNRRDNVFMTYKGQVKIMTDWASIVGIDKGTLWWRLNQGWSDADALSTPIYSRRPKKITVNN